MNDAELVSRLEAMRERGYPLTIDEDDAEALVMCITRIMDSVPEDEKTFVRGDYNLATAALIHPAAESLPEAEAY